MNAQQAFARFEKAQAGIFPFILLSGIAIAGTVATVHLIEKVPDRFAQIAREGLSIGMQMSKSAGYSQRIERVSEQSERFDKLRKWVEEISVAFPSHSYQYVGTFKVVDSDLPEFHVYTDTAHEKFFEVYQPSAQIATSKAHLSMRVGSITDDEQVMIVSNTKVPGFMTPWTKFELLEAAGDWGTVVQSLADAHQKLVESSTLRKLEPTKLVEIYREQAERTGTWLIGQSPITFSMFRDYLGVSDEELPPKATAVLLMGFSNGASHEYDRVAIEAFRQQAIEGGREPPAADQLMVLHAMTNELHLAELFSSAIAPETFSKRLHTEWLPRVIELGKSDPQQVQNFLKELELSHPLTDLGTIVHPFQAQIFQRSATTAP